MQERPGGDIPSKQRKRQWLRAWLRTRLPVLLCAVFGILMTLGFAFVVHLREESALHMHFEAQRHPVALPGAVGTIWWVLALGGVVTLLTSAYLSLLLRQRAMIQETVRRRTAQLRESERRLAESRNFLKHIIDNVADPIFVKDREHRWIEGNRAFWAILGVPEQEALHKSDYDFFPKEQADSFWYGDEQTFERGEYPTEEEISNHKGELRLISTKKTRFEGAQGRPCLVGVIRDVTELKQAEAELKRHRDHLQELVEERTEALLQARDAAEAASRAKSTFLANMSHELRTPMHAILSFARHGLENLERGGTKEDLEEICTDIRASGERLLHLLNDLLDLSKLEAGKLDFTFRRCDVAGVIHHAVREMSGLIQHKELHVELALEADTLIAEADHDKLLQVMINLLSNAIRFTQEGTTITISAQTATLAQEDAAGRPALRVSIADEGIGIAEDELDAVFDAFVQSRKTRSKAGGTGLGLAICREIITMHDGVIYAQHRPEGGAMLTFIIPLHREKP